MIVAFNVVAVVRAFVETARTLNDIRGFDLRLASREIWKKNLLGVAVLARETKIPLAGGKRTHSLGPRLRNRAMRNGA